MWENSIKKPFILKGNNASFYIDLSQSLVDHLLEFCLDINEQDDFSEKTGCVIFDNATTKQKVFLLNYCLKALLSENIEAPKPNHILEASAYWPFAYLEGEIEGEIERQIEVTIDQEQGKYKEDYFEDYFFFTFSRRKTYAIYKQNLLSFQIASDIVPSFQHELETLEEWQEYYQKVLALSPESTNIKEWYDIINQLAHDLVLGDDEDFRITSYKPQVVDGITWSEENMGISDEYFTNQLPRVTDEEYQQAVEEIFNYKVS